MTSSHSTDQTQGRTSADRTPGSASQRLLLGAGIAGIFIVAFLWSRISSRPGSSSAAVEPLSVAVLPFTNISDDPGESDYIADGVSQAVAIKLTQVGLRVTPWAMARRYRHHDQPPQAIARELDVDALLVGTFQLAGDEILATVSLMDAETGFQTWADLIVEPYDRVFDVQLRLATGVASSLKTELTIEEKRLLAAPASTSVDAYDLYLQGAHLMQQGTQEATEAAYRYFGKALEIDSGLVEAHVGRGAVHTAGYALGWRADLASLEAAEASFAAALRLAPADSRARRGLIYLEYLRGRSEAALAQGREAARLGSPDDVEAILARAQGLALRRPDR